MNEQLSFVNGEPGISTCLADRGFRYGHGLFETMRLSDREIPLWRYHQQRLVSGAVLLHIPLDDRLFDKYLAPALACFPPHGIVRMTVTAEAEGRGYRCEGPISARYFVQWFNDAPSNSAPVSLQPCRYRLSDNPALAGLKHMNRLDQVMAAQELDEQKLEYGDGLLLDCRDNIVEALSSNIFIFADGVWATPDLSRCGVAGVMRGYLLQLLSELPNTPAQVTDIAIDRLRRAQEVFICNSVVGIRPVAKILNFGEWPSPGVATSHLQAELARRIPCFGN